MIKTAHQASQTQRTGAAHERRSAREFQALVFDDILDSSSPLYISPEFNDDLGAIEELSIFGVAIAISGTSPALSVQIEESPDQIHWRNKRSTPEINAAAISLSTFTKVRGHDSGTLPSSGFIRLRVEVGGTAPRVSVKLWVALRSAWSCPRTPLSILGASVLQWVRADLGVTLDTGVSVWADQSGKGRNYVQATAGAQPAYSGSDATLNGQASMTFDGTDDKLVCSPFTLPAPATTPTWVWLIVKSITWTHLDRIVGDDGADTHIVYQHGTTRRLPSSSPSRRTITPGWPSERGARSRPTSVPPRATSSPSTTMRR